MISGESADKMKHGMGGIAHPHLEFAASLWLLGHTTVVEELDPSFAPDLFMKWHPTKSCFPLGLVTTSPK